MTILNSKKTIEGAINRALEERHFEDILEDFDLTAEEVFYLLFKQGYIEQELLERLYGLY